MKLTGHQPPAAAPPLPQLTAQHAEGLYAEGRERLLGGDPAGAESFAHAFALVCPSDPRAWLLLGAVRQARGRVREAANLYLLALALDAGQGEAAAAAVRCFRHVGDLRSADAIERAWSHAPELAHGEARS